MLDPTAAITFVIIRATEAVLIIVGNSLAIFIFWTQTFRQRRACLLLINLSAADLLVGVAESLILATKKTQTRGQERDVKHPLSPFRAFAYCTSVFFLALISLERVCAVFWPVRHRVSSLHIYVCSIVTVWFIGLVYGVLLLLSLCLKEVNRDYVSVVIHICLFVSFLVTCISYVKIRRRVICTSREQNTFNTSNRLDASNTRLSRTLFGVFAISFLLCLPASVVFIAKAFCKSCVPRLLIPAVGSLRLANSMVNPLVYSFKMPAFKNALGKLRRKWRQNIEIRPAQEEQRLS
ncbi:PREDICTED: adenosine receptor A2a-like [Acropora digitifera]|uniref:adenosine receptor A2a-like n=1 Tax=Acropora digitifera TaxID=70779 RepID=UPI00077A317E|nr:PREDICTED: adenosine receptor A2a-like [Acropora digitifera]